MRLKYLVRKIAHKVYTITDNDYDLNPHSDGEYNLLKRLLHEAPANSTFFDVGGAYGDWAMFVRSKRNDTTVHIFDPFPEMTSYLRERFKNDSNVKINQVAISDGEVGLDFYADTYSLHSRRSVGRPGNHIISVEAVKLDDYIREKNISSVYFMKMDIEGHEPFALRGAKEGLQRGVFKYIQFEYGGCNIDSRTYLKDFFDIFQGLPYRIGKLHPHHVEYFPSYNRLVDNFYDCNWIAEKI